MVEVMGVDMFHLESFLSWFKAILDSASFPFSCLYDFSF